MLTVHYFPKMYLEEATCTQRVLMANLYMQPWAIIACIRSVCGIRITQQRHYFRMWAWKHYGVSILSHDIHTFTDTLSKCSSRLKAIEYSLLSALMNFNNKEFPSSNMSEQSEIASNSSCVEIVRQSFFNRESRYFMTGRSDKKGKEGNNSNGHCLFLSRTARWKFYKCLSMNGEEG